MSFCCEEHFVPSNIMDQWILSFTQSLVTFVREEMESELSHVSQNKREIRKPWNNSCWGQVHDRKVSQVTVWLSIHVGVHGR